MTNYANGRAFEYRVMELLRDAGYTVVRSAGSKGAADLVAIKPGQVLFVQCKTSGQIGPSEWYLFYKSACEAGAVAVVAHRPKRGAVSLMRVLGFKKPRERRPWEEFQL